MAKETLFNRSFLLIEYDTIHHFIYHQWRGYIPVSEIKVGCEAILAAVIQKSCYLIVSDQLEVKGTWSQALRWMETDYLPRLVNTRNIKIAFIYSRQMAAQYSLNRLLEVNDQYVAQAFEDYSTAENWLLERAETDSSPTGMLSIRQNGIHKVIDLNDIYYLSIENNDVCIKTKRATYNTRSTLKALIKKLSPDFQQIHRSYIINIKEVSTVKYYAGGSYHAFLKDLPKMSIPVSRNYAPILKKRLGIKGR